MAVRNESQYFAPGTFNFKNVSLRDFDIDIRWKVLEINIFESIFQPCMTADITIVDADNLVANLPIVEGHIVDIHLGINEDDKIQQMIDGEDIKIAMEVIKITSRIKMINQDAQTYTLRLASVGWSNNVRTRVSRAYKKKSYSDMVQDIFDSKFALQDNLGLFGQYSEFNEDDVKPLNKEDTHGEFSVVIPRWKPIQAINWLAGRSQSKNNKNAVNYVFYEDKNQYNFVSISSLMEQEPTEMLFVKLENIQKDDVRNYQNIYSYSYHDTGDVLVHADNGTFGSRLIVHNMVTKEVDDHFPSGIWSLNYNIHGYPANQDEFGVIGSDPFSYNTEFPKTSHTDPNQLIAKDVAETLASNPGNTRLLVRSTHRFQYDGQKTDHPEEWMRQRIMQKPQSKYIMLTINTIGNFKRKAGEMIYIKLPSPEETKGKDDARLTGRYLVVSVRRVFKPTRHEVVMEVIKDGLYTDSYGDENRGGFDGN
jgi:hypothetical protein